MRIGPSVILNLMLLAFAASSWGQSAPSVARIGALHLGTRQSAVPFIEAFQRGLRQLGYIEGKNIIVDYRYGQGKEEKYKSLAAELTALKPSVIVSWGTDVTDALKKTTTSLPIVFALADRPDLLGLVDSLSRPGGNVTGLTTLSFELSRKRLELLKETIPSLARVTIVTMPHPLVDVTLKETHSTAQSLGIQLQPIEIKGPGELSGTFKELTKDRPGAILFLPASEVVYAPPAVSMAITHRLPTMGAQAVVPDSGGLISYGARTTELSTRAAVYVDKILKGAKPAELPVCVLLLTPTDQSRVSRTFFKIGEIVFKGVPRKLRELGSIDHRNITFETRFADSNYGRFPALAMPQRVLLKRIELSSSLRASSAMGLFSASDPSQS